MSKKKVVEKKFVCDDQGGGNNCGILDFVLEDGYAFGDTLLEGVMFKITIVNGKMKAIVTEEAKDYMENLNEKKWLSAAVAHAEENDIFSCPKCNGDVCNPLLDFNDE